MKIELDQPLCFLEKGKRSNNEDCIYPKKEDLLQDELKVFIVCDGVGGAEKGEVASAIVCEAIAKIVLTTNVVNKEVVLKAIHHAENEMQDYIQQHQDSGEMATTLTMLALDEEGVTIAHIGDSRVYHIRDGEILFKTSDHSFVNELISEGIITEEEAKVHPKRNIITKAIRGGVQTIPDIQKINEIKYGDYFILCSDGVSEAITDKGLSDILSNDTTNNNEKVEEIKALCSLYSRDNYSAYLLQIKNVI